MSEYGPDTYGEKIAHSYDEWYAGAEEAAIGRLANLAGDGEALELGIGTGRFAIPLAKAGVRVRGIDASSSMIEKLRSKSGGEDIPVTLGDFADVDVDGPFSLVFVVFNTFFGLPTQEAQVRCFRNIAERLEPGGAFLMEAFVPDLTRFDRNQRVSVSRIEGDAIHLEATMHDRVAQRSRTRHVVLTDLGVRTYPVEVRYAYPPELDLMARLAGLEPSDRWGGWNGEPFTAESVFHVSVWRKPG